MLPSHKTAAVCSGPQEPLQIYSLPLSAPLPGEAVVALEYAALNRRDWWIQQGQYAGLRYPMVPGSDGTGIVVACGSGEDVHWLHRRVIINPGMNWGPESAFQSRDFSILGLPADGTMASHVTVPAGQLMACPAYLSGPEAAALPLAGLTGYRALFTKGKLTSGMDILITGIGGGVALLMMQMALAAGARVYVTSGDDDKIAKAVSLGATLGVNYKMSGWHKLLQQGSNGFDLIVDSAGGDSFRHFVDLARPGGKIVFFGGTQGAINGLNPQKMYWKQLQLLGTTMGTPEEFSAMAAFFEAHSIRPVIDEIYPLTGINPAFTRLTDSSQFGKLVIDLTSTLR